MSRAAFRASCPRLSMEEVTAVGRYFGREPRYSQQEAEAQAKEALDAAVKRGRPPAEEWNELASRMGDIDRDLAARPPVPVIPSPPPRRAEAEGKPGNARRPRAINEILRAQPAPEPEPAAPRRATRSAAPAAPAKAPRAAAAGPTRRTPKASAPVATPAKRVASPAAGDPARPKRAAAPAPARRSAAATDQRPTAPAKRPAAPAKRPAAKKRPG
jgi:hypothetical protein